MRALLIALAAAAGAAHAQAPGDAQRGRQLYESRCVACHSVDAHRTGPLHLGVVGRVAGTVAGFRFSPALAQSRVRWDAKSLDAWLADPELFAPGQAMGYSVPAAQDRADLIAYLATLKGR